MRIPAGIPRGHVVLLTSLVLLFAFLSVRPSVAEEAVRVLANLPLERMHVNEMFLQQRGNRTFLYLHRPRKDVFALVDVTRPDKPALVSRDVLEGASPGPAAGSAFAITVKSEQADPAAKLPSDTVNFVDLSNPKNVKTIKSFEGVTAMYSDDARKLVYLVNGEGLWIVSHSMSGGMRLCPAENCPVLAGP